MATPKLSFHKSKRQYFARFDGKMVYFGKDPAEAHQRFAEAYTQWQAGETVASPTSQDAITTVEAAERYIAYAKRYYGPDATEPGKIQDALQRLCRLYGRAPLANLSPKKLKTFQQSLIQEGRLTRPGINKALSAVKRFLRWCASEELVSADVWHAAQTVEGLRKGRTEAAETEPVQPVPLEHVEAAKAHLPSPVCALIDLQLLTAARPSELLFLRPQDIDTSTEPWTVRPERHKTAHKGRDRQLFFGPKAQHILRPFLLRDSDAYLFNPHEATAERNANAKTPRRPNQPETTRKTSRRVQDHYTKDSYRRAITRACEKADIPKWTPYRLRHTAATEIRRQYGLEGAQVVLGHAALGVTQVYAERDFEKAARIISEVG